MPSFCILGSGPEASEIRWKTAVGSTEPDRVPPTNPSKGVKPMPTREVSYGPIYRLLELSLTGVDALAILDAAGTAATAEMGDHNAYILFSLTKLLC